MQSSVYFDTGVELLNDSRGRKRAAIKEAEIEMYTGTQGDIVGLSDQIVSFLDGFVRDQIAAMWNVTPPIHQYHQLLCNLLRLGSAYETT